ncbi:MAG: MFS transporter [Alphaproteobacteria bacterium]|jgi:MFS family permease|nr:MFS transporter [Alphaproteobacteria bacterium]
MTARRIITFINIAHTLDHLVMLILPTAVLGMAGVFGLGYGEILSLSIGGFIAFGAGSLPAGWLGDRWSRRHMMTVFFIGTGAACILAGLSTSAPMFAVSLTLVGLFAAIYHPVGGALLVASAAKLGRTIGFNGVCGNLGVAGAALITGAITQAFGWRAAFIVPGLAAIAAGIAYVLLVHDVEGAKVVRKVQVALPPRAVMIRAFAVLAVVTIAGGVVFNAATVALPKLLDERLPSFADQPFGVGAIASLVYLAGALAQASIGSVIDRVPLKTVFVPLAILQAPCLYFAATAEGWAVVWLTVPLMVAIFGQVTVNDAMIARYTADEWRARAFSVRYFMSFAAAATAVPMVAGLHEKTGGFATTFMVLAAGGLIIFLAALMFPLRREEVAPQLATGAAE